VTALDEAALLPLLAGRRWFGGAERVEHARVVSVPVEDGPLRVVVAEVRRTGLPVEHVALVLREGSAADGLAEPELARRLAALAGVATPCRSVRPIAGEQSNSSVVLDERHVLKLYRRLEAGPAPEVELLRALTLQGAAPVPALEGALETTMPPVPTALCSVTALVPAVGDGWALALDSLGADPGWLPERAHRLGEATASLHAALGALDGRELAPTPAPPGALGEVAARLGRELAVALSELPAGPETAPVAGRADDLYALVAEHAAGGPCGPLIRTHGDYHLGQVLWTPGGDWVAIDLEGEPGRPLAERRERRSPLRDVAGMLRSFAYAADAAPRLRGTRPPAGWLVECRSAFLAGYLASADERLLPAATAVESQLALFELEKLVYELRYELRNRPSWVGIPVAGLVRLLGEAA
jgi:predicted trehalose synthase